MVGAYTNIYVFYFTKSILKAFCGYNENLDLDEMSFYSLERTMYISFYQCIEIIMKSLYYRVKIKPPSYQKEYQNINRQTKT